MSVRGVGGVAVAALVVLWGAPAQAAVGVAAAAAAVPAGTAAAVRAAAAPAPAPAPVVAPPPAPVVAAPMLRLSTRGVSTDRRRRVVLAGSRWAVRGSLSRFVPGQRMTVRLYRGSKRVAARLVAVRQAGARGTFAVRFSPSRPGRVVVRAGHAMTPELAAVRSRGVGVTILRARAAAGSSGPVVRLLQARLAAMAYAISRSGRYDAATARAVVAYRKVNGLERVGSVDAALLRRIAAGRGAYRVRHPRGGHHVEADLSRQVVSLVSGSRVVRTYPTSSGKASTPTVRGTFRIYRKDPGTNALGMVNAAYFLRGYAIHGYVDVPTVNASHGCLRVPVPNARAIFDWLRFGDRVYVDG